MRDLFSIFIVALPAVFFVVDPFGVVPIFLTITARDAPEKVRTMALRACLVGGGLLLFFALFGGLIFKVFGVTLGAFRIAGGILLLITSLDMLRGRTSQTKTSPEEEKEGAQKEDVAVVPLAIPLLAGPGSIATVMVLMSKGKGFSPPFRCSFLSCSPSWRAITCCGERASCSACSDNRESPSSSA